MCIYTRYVCDIFTLGYLSAHLQLEYLGAVSAVHLLVEFLFVETQFMCSEMSLLTDLFSFSEDIWKDCFRSVLLIQINVLMMMYLLCLQNEQ